MTASTFVTADPALVPPPITPAGPCALAELVDRFDAFVRRTALRHGLSGPEVDEVVQDLRIRIWRAMSSPAGVRSINARYVYRVAVSASLDAIRRGRTRAARALSLEQVEPTALGVAGAVEQRLDAADLARAVEQALCHLEPARRAAVRLYLRGYDRFEIAQLTGVGVGRARNLLYRGLADLRRQLRAGGVESPAHGQGIPAPTQPWTAACQA